MVNAYDSVHNTLSNQPMLEPDPHYKKMWMHERNRRIEAEQEIIRLRSIMANTHFSANERIVAMEIVDQIQEAKHVDEQGRKLFSQKQAAERTGLSRNTIGTAVDTLTESGFIKNRATKTLRDKDGKLVTNRKGKPINTTHLDIDQDLYEDFSRAERSTPRKVGEDRKPYTYQCQTCLSEDVTIETSRHLVCKNPNCKAHGKKVLIDVDYKDQLPENPNSGDSSTEILNAQNLCTIELLDNDAQNLCIQNENESNNPPLGDSATPDHTAIISDWLERRRGTARIIQSTGILKTEDKYKSKAEGYEPDMEAYIQGKIGHIYGSWLRNPETGLTSVLSFDFDSLEYNELAQDCLLALARAGAAAIYWQRQRNRGHLELYFDRPVNPEVARLWATQICPDLADVDECFPSHGKENRQHTALSWPMWQRIEGTVHACLAYAILPAPHAGDLQIVDPTNGEQVSQLVTNAVTPATLIEEFATVLAECEKVQSREQERDNAPGGVSGIKPSPSTQVGSKDLVKQVIADFNCTHRIEDMVELNKKHKFAATWRGERTASVALDRGGEYATDHGKNGRFPKKLDAYEVYCLINNIDKKADLAERCAQLRRAEMDVVQPANIVSTEAPVAQPFADEERVQAVYYTPCIVCGSPKNVKRDDGVYVCGVNHS